MSVTSAAKRKAGTILPPGETNGHAGETAGALNDADGVEAKIPVAHVHPSPFNNRQRFDPAELEKLAASMKAHGVLQAILVRPRRVAKKLPTSGAHKAAADGYELIVGERRLRAAKLAGLGTIRARVVEKTDTEVREIIVIENEQREDTSPLEKAEGYAALIEQDGYTPDRIGERVGKSPSTIRAFLKLRQLPAVARPAAESGHLPMSTALLIARIPGDKARADAARYILGGEFYGKAPTDAEAQRVVAAGEPPLSVREAKELVERRYMVELKGAPFSRKALDLVPAAGSCEACPKLVANLQKDDPEGYQGVRADVCTDPGCYAEKEQAHHRQLLDRARAEGKTVLPKKEAKELFATYNPRELAHDAPYVDLAKACHDVAGGKTWRQLVGKALADQVVLATDHEDGVHELVPKAAAMKVLRRDHGVKARDASGDKYDAGRKREEAKRRAEDLLAKEAGRRCMGRAAAAAEHQFARLLNWTPELTDLLRAVVAAMVDNVWDDVSRHVRIRRQLPRPEGGHSGGNRECVQALLPTLNGPQLLGLLTELNAGYRAFGVNYGGDKERKQWWAAFDVDPAAVEKEVRAELREKKDTPAGGKKKPAGDGQGDAKAAPTIEPPAAAPAGIAAGGRVQEKDGGPFGKVIAVRRGSAGEALDVTVEWDRQPGQRKPQRTHEDPADLVVVAGDANGAAAAVEPPASPPPAAGWRGGSVADLLAKPVGLSDADVEALGTQGVRTLGELDAAFNYQIGRHLGLTAKKAKALKLHLDGLKTVTRATALVDLITESLEPGGPGVAAQAAPLAAAGLRTVGDLLDRAAKAKGSAPLYAVLREVSGILPGTVYEIGDRLVDFGLSPDGTPAAPSLTEAAKAAWRQLPVERMEGEVADTTLAHLRRLEVKTLGEVADRIAAGSDFGLEKPARVLGELEAALGVLSGPATGKKKGKAIA